MSCFRVRGRGVGPVIEIRSWLWMRSFTGSLPRYPPGGIALILVKGSLNTCFSNVTGQTISCLNLLLNMMILKFPNFYRKASQDAALYKRPTRFQKIRCTRLLIFKINVWLTNRRILKYKSLLKIIIEIVLI
jgi:hypothetical protein